MIISFSRRFTFIHIHKAGGTSLETALEPFLAWRDIILGSTHFGELLNKSYAKRFKLSKHSGVREILRTCGRGVVEKHFLFALVRDPVDRACSLYNFIGGQLRTWAATRGIDMEELKQLVASETNHRAALLNWHTTRTFLAAPGFSEFIRDESVLRDRSFHSQVAQLTDPKSGALMGAFFRLEERDQWLAELRQRLGVEFEFPHLNQSSAGLIRQQDLAPSDLAYLRQHFADDYRAFYA